MMAVLLICQQQGFCLTKSFVPSSLERMIRVHTPFTNHGRGRSFFFDQINFPKIRLIAHTYNHILSVVHSHTFVKSFDMLYVRIKFFTIARCAESAFLNIRGSTFTTLTLIVYHTF